MSLVDFFDNTALVFISFIDDFISPVSHLSKKKNKNKTADNNNMNIKCK